MFFHDYNYIRVFCTDACLWRHTGDGEYWRLAASLRVSDIITLTTDIVGHGVGSRGILIVARLVNYCSRGRESVDNHYTTLIQLYSINVHHSRIKSDNNSVQSPTSDHNVGDSYFRPRLSCVINQSPAWPLAPVWGNWRPHFGIILSCEPGDGARDNESCDNVHMTTSSHRSSAQMNGPTLTDTSPVTSLISQPAIGDN